MTDRNVRLKTPESYRDTSVSVQRSIASLESILDQFGCEATSIAIVRRGERAGAEVRFVYGKQTYSVKIDLGVDPKEHRQKMRVLYWGVKAMLEMVAFGVVTAEEVLLPFAEITDGAGGRTTVGRALTTGGGHLPSASPEGLMADLGMRALPLVGEVVKNENEEA